MQTSRSRGRSRMSSLHHSQSSPESYVRLQGRRWRRGAKGFRLCPRNRFSVRRLRAELLTFLGLVGRYVRLLVRKMSTSSSGTRGGGGGNGGCARSGSRRALVVTGGKDKVPAAASRKPAPFIARSNSFYSQAIADCLEFIKLNSVPIEDYGSVSARRYAFEAPFGAGTHKIESKKKNACSFSTEPLKM